MPNKSKSLDSAHFEKVRDFRESEQEEYARKKKIAYSLVGVVAVLALGIIVALVTWFVLKDPPPPTLPQPFATNDYNVDITNTDQLSINLKLPSTSNTSSIKVHLLNSTSENTVKNCAGNNNNDNSVCYEVTKSGTKVPYKVSIVQENYPVGSNFTCLAVKWSGHLEGEIEDCVEMGHHYWYGGGLLYRQHWPMQIDKPSTPFLSADILQQPTDYGSVLEPYWISSSGAALIAKWDAKDQPLYSSFNQSGDNKICLKSRFHNSPYKPVNKSVLNLEYAICTGENIAHVHKSVLKYRSPWLKPSGLPEPRLFEEPIWSTWVSYKHNITQEKLGQFVEKIRANKFTAANIEIDDGYQQKYGDFSFNPDKFPDPKAIVDEINSHGFNVTMWMYPFINYNAEIMAEALANKYLVMAENHVAPAATWWWPDQDSKFAGMVDFTNETASNWYFARLVAFQQKYGIHSFKFDAGENNWTPACHRLSAPTVSPENYGRTYAEKAAEKIGNGLEVRVGLHTQQLPVFVRMLDKDSVVGYENGLQTLIPTALVFGVLGYPFVLPDMIGGNAYKNATNSTVSGLLENQYPTEELFVRWVAATVFMPSIQFSITPWSYDERRNDNKTTCVDVTLKLMSLRVKYHRLFLDLAEDSLVTGHPIIRPLWWNDGSDERTWTIDDQFLVGDDLMVAPLLNSLVNNYREIYLPSGRWFDTLTGETQVGGKTITRKVELDQVPVFERRSL